MNPGILPKTLTRLSDTSSLKGTLRFRESVAIHGSFEGEIAAEGYLYIAPGAEVRADIRADTIIIGGIVHGNVDALGRLEMLAGCKIYGNVRTRKLRIADGVVFEGKCQMVRNADGVDIFASPQGQLRETLGTPQSKA